ncbi:hypothetical protein SLOPH_2549, partial [Spraguea lophii 42_110]
MKFYILSLVTILFFNIKEIFGICMYCTEIKVRRMLNLDNKRKIRNYGMANNEHRENGVQEESSTRIQTNKTKNCLKSHINNFGKGIKTNVTNLFKPLKNYIVKHTNYTSLSNRPLPLLPFPYHCSKTKTYRRQMISKDNEKVLDTKDISSESIYAECLDNNTSSEPIYVNHPFDNELPEPIYVNHQFDNKLPEITYADLIF